MKVRFVVAMLAVVAVVNVSAQTRFLAMRAEVSIVGAVDSKTAAEVTIQVAPEDRKLLGDRSWLRGELIHGKEVVDRFSQAVQFDRRGRSIVEVSWPSGEYEFRVEIETSGGARGIYIGKVTVPELEPTPDPEEDVEPTPEPEPDTEQAAVVEESIEVEEPKKEQPPSVAEQTATDEPTTTDAVEDVIEPVVIPEPKPEPVKETASTETPSPPPETESREPPPAAVTEIEPVVEVASEPESPPRSSEVRMPLAPAAVGTADLTLVVTLKNKPVEGLDATTLRVRVGREDAQISSLRGPGSAPLLLGLVVGGSSLRDIPELEQHLGRMALNADDLFVVTSGAEPIVLLDWGATAVDLPSAFERSMSQESGGSLASAISASLARLKGRSGRRMLVVVTDGDSPTEKAEWKSAENLAQQAGVPVLSVGVEDEDFDVRTRRALSTLAAVSGGKNYSIRESGMLKLVFDHFRDLASATAELRFEIPVGKRNKNASIRVESADSRLEIRHSRRIE